MVWVAVLLASIVGQYRQMIGDPVALVATPYGRLALVKAALFAAMLGLAWLNRNRLVPLAGSRRGRVALLASIGAEAGLGLLAVLTAGWLAQTMPANHMQPVWPFGWRPSLSAVREDADIAWEVASAGWLLLLAAMLLLAALRLRGARRLVALVGAPLLVAAAWPHLDVLVVPADRNSFAVSPTGFAASSILAGASVYARNCASCHGAGGHGDGAGAAGLPVPPADLTAPHLWAHADGELFGWISDGIRAPDGRQAMPGFAGVLSPGQRWAVIDFIRARNAGGIAAQGGSWTVPVQAPPMRVACADGDMTLARLAAGGWVRLAFGAAPPSVLAGARLVWMDEDATAQPGRCAARQTGLASAYAILSGVSPQDLEAAQILVDPQGRLRAIAPRGWHDPASLERAMETLSKVAPRLPDPASMTGMGPMQGMKM